jgi:bifunctional UDP-N-acetylglucosamine pyrophosphorylase/glucosamine-1-phosphate N-acetyltransferase
MARAIREAVILAAGLGTRLLPLTENRPKAMIPVGGRPLIDHLLSALRDSGIERAIVVIGHGGERVASFVGDGSKWRMEVEYAIQRTYSGTADALRAAEGLLREDSFLLAYGDLLVGAESIRSVLGAWDSSGGFAVVGAVEVRDPRDFGLLIVDGDSLVDLIEKPEGPAAGRALANAGIFALPSEIMRFVSRTGPSERGELELTDSIRMAIEEGHTVRISRLNESDWMDLGRPWDVLEANKRVLAKARGKVEGEVEGGAEILGDVIVSEGAVVKRGSRVEGPAFLGRGAIIGPSSRIRPYTSIGEGAVVGNFCEVKNSIVQRGTKIPHLSYLGDSIVGEDCNFGAGTIVANLRLDSGTIKMRIKDKVVDTGLRKFGAVIGDGVRTGINVSIMPGVKIGGGALIGPGCVIYNDIEPGMRVFCKQELTIKPP